MDLEQPAHEKSETVHILICVRFSEQYYQYITVISLFEVEKWILFEIKLWKASEKCTHNFRSFRFSNAARLDAASIGGKQKVAASFRW